jgi:predicted small lipoprotein YifL
MKRARKSLAVIVSLAFILTGCGTSDPLAISCADFLSKDSETQLALATRWGAPNREHVGPMEEMVGPQYKRDLLEYCPTHPDAKLSELELRLGPNI